jgi:hypothetical protein
VAPAGTLSGATITSTVTGSSLTSVGTITTGVWHGTAIGAAYGGTGQSAVTTGDLLYGSAANTWSRLADVATGNALISNGVGVAPIWGDINLTSTVTGILPVANGGTGASTGGTTGYAARWTSATGKMRTIFSPSLAVV